MEGGTTWPEHLGSGELRDRSAMPMTVSGLQTPRWPQRARSASFKGSTRVYLLTAAGAAGTECRSCLHLSLFDALSRGVEMSLPEQRALGTSGSRKDTGP